MPPYDLPLSLLLGASVRRVPPDPLQNPASHSLWVTSSNLRVLSQARVRCTHTPFPMCPCPLLPWAFRMSVHRHSGNVRPNPIARTETRSDAPTYLPARNPKVFYQTSMFPRPPRLNHPCSRDCISCLFLGFGSTVSHEYCSARKLQRCSFV